MKFSVKLLETDMELQNRVLTALLPECNTFLRKSFTYIRQNIPPIISKAITNRPEYMSLVSGKLRLELGIPDAASKVAELINFWITNVFIDFKQPTAVKSKIKSSFSVSLIKADFSDILGSDAAFVHDSLRGYSLPWLEWLLLDGRKVIVPKQQVIIAPNPRSRTGLALMRESTEGWRIPSEFVGTIRDNWITRAIDNSSADINDLIERSLS